MVEVDLLNKCLYVIPATKEYCGIKELNEMVSKYLLSTKIKDEVKNITYDNGCLFFDGNFIGRVASKERQVPFTEEEDYWEGKTLRIAEF